MFNEEFLAQPLHTETSSWAIAFPPEFLLEKLHMKAIIFKQHGIFEDLLEKNKGNDLSYGVGNQFNKDLYNC